MSEVRVRVEQISFQVGDALLVDAATFTAREGEFIGVIGPNGAGKSTLLGLVGGTLTPRSGSVELMGSVVSSLSTRELSTMRSMLGADPPSDIPFTVRTVVSTGRYPFRGLPGGSQEDDERRVDEAMERSDVTALAHRVYRTLSSGEKARVMVARILAQDSPVALLDEPTASLDVAHNERTLAALTASASSSTTVIAVLHDLNSAAFYCDRLLLMDQATIVGFGAPEEVLTSDVLTDVYGQKLEVVDHPSRGCPLVLVS